MKRYAKNLTLLVAAMAPMLAFGQKQIQQAFDNLLQNSECTYADYHSLERNAESQVKESQCDYYDFTLPKSKIKLVNDVLAAFATDNDKAYTVSSGKSTVSSQQVQLAIGDGELGISVTVPGRDFIYSCFMAPSEEDPDGIYRYGYAMNWEKVGDSIEGRLIVTYAQTLKHRQEVASRSQSNGVWRFNPNQNKWISDMSDNLQALSTCTKESRRFIAQEIYNLSRECVGNDEVSATDRRTVEMLITQAIDEYAKDANGPLYIFLSQALENIKDEK